MQHLTTLSQIVNAATTVADMARASQTYRFGVTGSLTFYLHTANAEVRVARWAQPFIEVTARLQAPFGWRIVTDQDDAGVYFVALRRPIVGGLAGATFHANVPYNTHLALKLENGHVWLENINGTLQIPPQVGDKSEIQLAP